MLAFAQHPTILQSDEARTLVKNYNKLTKVLLEYELLYHRAWLRQVSHHTTVSANWFSVVVVCLRQQ